MLPSVHAIFLQHLVCGLVLNDLVMILVTADSFAGENDDFLCARMRTRRAAVERGGVVVGDESREGAVVFSR